MVNDAILRSFIVEDLSSTLHLVTPNGWQPNATITLTFERGVVGLASNGWNSLFSTPFTTPFTASTTYFFGFQVFIERGTYFSFLTLTNTHQAWHSVAYLRAADNVSRLLPIRLRGMHQPAVNT